MRTNVEDLMTRTVHTCRPGDGLNVPARLMWENDCGCIPVIDDAAHVVGILTDRDVCMATYTQGRAPAEIPCSAVMSRGVHFCAPGDPVAFAERTMRLHQVRRLPVIGPTGELLGILALNDLAMAGAALGARGEDGLSPVAIETTLASVGLHRLPGS